jgi:hypothetical protein
VFLLGDKQVLLGGGGNVSSLNDTEDAGTMEEREQPTGGRSRRPSRKVYASEWVNV